LPRGLSIYFTTRKPFCQAVTREEAAFQLSIFNFLRAFEGATVEIARCTALCSFYAERGGLLIGFEKGKEN
jgi:hypothetical protein